MKHKQDAIKIAEEIIASHIANGCTPEMAHACAITTVKYINKITFARPISEYQRALNYLTKDIPKATIEEIERDGKLVNDYTIDVSEEEDECVITDVVKVYKYQDQTFHIIEWNENSSKSGKEIFRVY